MKRVVTMEIRCEPYGYDGRRAYYESHVVGSQRATIYTSAGRLKPHRLIGAWLLEIG